MFWGSYFLLLFFVLVVFYFYMATIGILFVFTLILIEFLTLLSWKWFIFWRSSPYSSKLILSLQFLLLNFTKIDFNFFHQVWQCILNSHNSFCKFIKTKFLFLNTIHHILKHFNHRLNSDINFQYILFTFCFIYLFIYMIRVLFLNLNEFVLRKLKPGFQYDSI